MSQYTEFENKTNAITDDLLALDAAATEDGAVIECIIGGEVVTSTAGRFKLARSSGGTVPVSSDVQKGHPNNPTNSIAGVDGWTAQPTLDAGALVGTGWNLHGGVVRWQAAPGEEFDIIGAEQISLREVLAAVVLAGSMIWTEV